MGTRRWSVLQLPRTHTEDGTLQEHQGGRLSGLTHGLGVDISCSNTELLVCNCMWAQPRD